MSEQNAGKNATRAGEARAKKLEVRVASISEPCRGIGDDLQRITVLNAATEAKRVGIVSKAVG